MSKTAAKRLELVKPSMIMGLVQMARQLANSGQPVIDLGIGEPDFENACPRQEGAIEAIQNNVTKYTVVAGQPSLREAISRKIQSRELPELLSGGNFGFRRRQTSHIQRDDGFTFTWRRSDHPGAVLVILC